MKVNMKRRSTVSECSPSQAAGYMQTVFVAAGPEATPTLSPVSKRVHTVFAEKGDGVA